MNSVNIYFLYVHFLYQSHKKKKLKKKFVNVVRVTTKKRKVFKKVVKCLENITKKRLKKMKKKIKKDL